MRTWCPMFLGPMFSCPGKNVLNIKGTQEWSLNHLYDFYESTGIKMMIPIKSAGILVLALLSACPMQQFSCCVCVCVCVCVSCPDAAIYVSACCYMCPHDAVCVSACCYICVRMLLYMCPHAAVYASSCCYICVLMLRPHAASVYYRKHRLRLD